MDEINQTQAKRIEAETRAKYSGKVYSAKSICNVSADSLDQATDMFDLITRYRFGLIRHHTTSAFRVLDVCCATGDHLHHISGLIAYGVGVDFSHPFLSAAHASTSSKKNLTFVGANARCLPFPDNQFSLAYSFSSLYYIPDVAAVVNEMARVIQPGGVCILDLGNRFSLNTVVCKAYPELAQPCHISLKQMRRIIHGANLAIVQHHAFQILPYWGNRPRWLFFLLHPIWKHYMEKMIYGKMVDEWLSNFPILKSFAFRHVLLCRKEESASA
jgi:ubiquinone/menaquinone biosynthesis C-methylase UbiE